MLKTWSQCPLTTTGIVQNELRWKEHKIIKFQPIPLHLMQELRTTDNAEPVALDKHCELRQPDFSSRMMSCYDTAHTQ